MNTAAQLQALVASVQRNCHVADARHAAELTLCTYLLQMREFFRWERGLPLGQPLARETVGAWMAEREALWETLADEDYAPLPLPQAEDVGTGGTAEAASAQRTGATDGGAAGRAEPGGTVADPFDVEAVNAALAPHALLYGAGLVGGGRPVFFIADLHGRDERGGLAVLQAGRERARTLLAPPAALGGGGAGPILLRRESMARWGWERAEAFGMRPRAGSALHAMLAHYGLDRAFQAGLGRWLDDQCETAVWHELGEHGLNRRWGTRWNELRAAVAGDTSCGATEAPACEVPQAPGAVVAQAAQAAQARRADALVRALRDQLADLGVTLPALLARGDPGPLHAWFAGYEGLRETLFPALTAGYAAWRGGDGGTMLRAQQALGLQHFESVATSLLEGSAAARAAARIRLLRPAASGVPAAMVCGGPGSGS